MGGVAVCEIDFLLKRKAGWWDPVDFVETNSWTQICASPNHGNVMKVEPSRLISRKLAANLKLLALLYYHLRSIVVILSFLIKTIAWN